jgi:hypothetical protein
VNFLCLWEISFGSDEGRAGFVAKSFFALGSARIVTDSQLQGVAGGFTGCFRLMDWETVAGDLGQDGMASA